MNKFLLASIILLPAITFAAEDISSSQSAIDPHGICEEFAIDEILPETWKIVDSCENYKSKETGASPESVLARRWKAFSNKLLNKKSEQESEEESLPILNRNRVGSGTLTRGGADREASLGEEQQPRRTTTTQQYGTTKQFLLDDSRRLEKSRDEWIRRRNARTGIKSGSATEMDRTGELSDKFWSTETATRNERLENQESTEGWEQYLYNRQYISKQGQKEKKAYIYKGPSLRRLYRGTRLEGTIE
jgi:hypothetical protein